MPLTFQEMTRNVLFSSVSLSGAFLGGKGGSVTVHRNTGGALFLFATDCFVVFVLSTLADADDDALALCV
jgi:hypothetical protein